ncbi:MAG: hypothetical protein AMXMBFR83_26450 [Phycisphaerae bacterium]
MSKYAPEGSGRRQRRMSDSAFPVRGVQRSVLLLVPLLAAGLVRAQERVVNGDFANGGASWIAWTAAGAVNRVFTTNPAKVPAGGAGPYFELFSVNGGTGGVYQPLNLVVGQEYLVSAVSRNAGGQTNVFADLFVGTVAPVNGQDYRDDGTDQSPPGTQHLFGWGPDCPTWNGGQFTSCASPLRFRFKATAQVMYLVIRGSGAGVMDVTFDNVSCRDAGPCPTPEVFGGPFSRFVCLDQTATFSIQAAGQGPLFYHWRRNGKFLSNGGHYSGVRTSELTVHNVDGTVVGDYDCVVTNICGSTVSPPARLSTSVIYVDADATGANKGTSWADAFTDLQTAILTAQVPGTNCPGAELWVANGVYKPTFNLNPLDPRGFTFLLADNVRLYGGFEGASAPRQYPNGETGRDQRDPSDPDRMAVLTHDAPLSRYVVTSIGHGPTTVLDGFVIAAAADAPGGCVAEFNVRDAQTTFANNQIITTPDRYLDLAPDPAATALQPAVLNNRIIVLDRPETPGPHGSLLELRQFDFDYQCQGQGPEACESGAFQRTASPGYADPWAIDRLEIRAGQRVSLTDRKGLNFHQGTREAVYVRTLILHDNAVLNTAMHRLYYRELFMAPTARIINAPMRGLPMEFHRLNDPAGADCVILRDPSTPPQAAQIVPDGHGPGDGVLRLRRLDNVTVAVTGRFARAGEERVGLVFEYRFFGEPSELIVSLSDSAEPGAVGIPIARIRPPQIGRPGSPGSPKFGLFQGQFPRGPLNLTHEAFVRLELVAPKAGGRDSIPPGAGGAVEPGETPDTVPFNGESGVDIDNWGARIVCTYGCADLSGDGAPDDRDYLLVLSLYGRDTSQVDLETGDCSDAVFGGDQYVDLVDLLTWDLILDPAGSLPNPCDVLGGLGFLAGDGPAATGSSAPAPDIQPFGVPAGAEGASSGDVLLVAGKSAANQFQEDALYTLDLNGNCTGSAAGAPAGGDGSRSNGRLVLDRHGEVYQLHGMSYGSPDATQGLIRLSDGANLVPPRTGLSGPAGMDPVTVTVGLNVAGFDLAGLPLADAAFHPTDDDVLYVSPVVVTPGDGTCPYKAVARLTLKAGQEPPYEVAALYGTNPAPTSSVSAGDCTSAIVYEPDTQQMREIEVDATETLYVTNAQGAGDNDFVLIYDGSTALNGEQSPIVTYSLDGVCDAPVALAVAPTADKLYLSSSVYVLTGAKTRVYRFSIQRSGGGSVIGLSADGSIDVNNPTTGDLGYGLVCTISTIIAAADGKLYCLGLTVPKVPADLDTGDPLYDALFGPYPTPLEPVFSTPTLAIVPSSFSGPVAASALSCHGLALPISGVITDVTAPTLAGAVSRKTHGTAGAFDIDLPLTGTPGSECRAGGPTQIVLTFSETIVADDGSPGANEVSLSAGTLSTVSISGKIMTINLSGVPDQSCLTVALSGLSDLAGNALSAGTQVKVRVIQADADGSGTVAAGDVTQTKGHSGQAVSSPIVRSDCTADGEVDCADIIRAKARLTRSATCP